MMTELKALAREGIVNRQTRTQSNRWQNSGGLYVAKGGEVKWIHVAKHAGDMADYRSAVKERSKL